jgi:hypothetical protein
VEDELLVMLGIRRHTSGSFPWRVAPPTKRTVVAAPTERVLEAARSWRAAGVLMMADIVDDLVGSC